MSWMNFDDAEQQSSGDVIPHKTLAKVRMKIRPGGYDDPSKGWTGGYATRSDERGSVYLDCEFTVVGGKYNKRKVWSLIGLYSANGPRWGEMGRSFIRAALESARGVKPNDTSEAAVKARQISGFADLDGLEFVVRIDVEEGQNGYDDRNRINNVIPATHKEYAELMSGSAPAPSSTPAAVAASNANGGGLPAWAT